jgi:hypothetical protein
MQDISVAFILAMFGLGKMETEHFSTFLKILASWMIPSI